MYKGYSGKNVIVDLTRLFFNKTEHGLCHFRRNSGRLNLIGHLIFANFNPTHF